MDMLNQPLLTDEGFVNPACLSELESAITNLPRTHDRLSGDPEWTTPRFTTINDITGAFAKYAIRQSPYGCPDNLEAVVKYLAAALKTAAPWDVGQMCHLSLCDISRMLYAILYEQGVTYFDAWNKCKRGETPNVKYTSAHDGPGDPDDDFIDLDALLHNVCLDIRLERRASDKFNAEFEAEHGNGNA